MKKFLPLTFLVASFLFLFSGTADAQLVPGVTYNSTGKVDCKREGTNEQFTCDYGIVKSGTDQAEIHILSPTGHIRKFKYAAGTVGFPEESEATLDTRKIGDTWTVTLNKRETYTIPNAVFIGG